MMRASIVLLTLAALCADCRTAASATVRSLPVPADTIYPGQAIAASQLMMRKFQTTDTSLSGIATDADAITGKEARRRLPAGKPIPLSVLQTPLAVRRGATAAASYDEDGLSISTTVTILQDGAVGDIIDARNMSTGAVIKVVVLADGSVKVDTE